MKMVFLFFSILMVAGAPAMADWADIFYENYSKKGIDHAVKTALSEGNSPDRIIGTAMPIEDLERAQLIKALFCALALPGSIYEAADAHGIPEGTVANGYQLALAECPHEMEENLNAAVTPGNQPPGLAPSNQGRGSSYASPWKFD